MQLRTPTALYRASHHWRWDAAQCSVFRADRKNTKSKAFYGPETPRIYYRRVWGQLSTTCSNVLNQSNGELLVAVNQNQLRTMASETVDLIDWSHPPPSWAVPPERLVHCINQCNIRGNRTCNRNMRGNHLAYAAGHSGYKGTKKDVHEKLNHLHTHQGSPLLFIVCIFTRSLHRHPFDAQGHPNCHYYIKYKFFDNNQNLQ